MAKSSSRKPRQGQLSLLAPDRAGEPESEWADPLPDDFQCAEMRAYQTFVAREEEMGNLSNSLPLWDATPKYAVPRNQQAAMRDVRGDLPEFQREFQYRGRTCRVRVRAARVRDSDGLGIGVYPSEREELVESALRYLACQQAQGFYTERSNAPQPVSGVTFTIHQIRMLLRERGRWLRHEDIVQALEVMRYCSITIETGDRRRDYGSPIISGVRRMAVDAGDDVDSEGAVWNVVFNRLVTGAIEERAYRQFDFDQMVRCKAPLTRWLYLALVHRWRNASMTHPMQMSLRDVQRDSGFLDYGRFRQAAEKLAKSFEELKEMGVLRDVEVEAELGPRQKIMDVSYVLRPTKTFVTKVVKANQRSAKLPTNGR